MDTPSFIYITEEPAAKELAAPEKVLAWKKAYEAMPIGEPFLAVVRSSCIGFGNDDAEYHEISMMTPTPLVTLFIAMKHKADRSPSWHEESQSLIFLVDRFAKSAENIFSLNATPLRVELIDPVANDKEREVQIIFGAEDIRRWARKEAGGAIPESSPAHWNDLIVKLFRMAAAVGYNFAFTEFLTVIKGWKCAKLIKRLAAIAAEKQMTAERKREAHAIIGNLSTMGVSEEAVKRYIVLELKAMATLDEIVPKV